jgi:O-6-methylguanine DNA methyltransferase
MSSIHPSAYQTFETPLGLCAIAWKTLAETGKPLVISAFQLPESSPDLTLEKIQQFAQQKADRPPDELQALIQRIIRHLSGDLQDFTGVVFDLGCVGIFAQQIYSLTQAIPPGQVRTYGEIARAANKPAAARAVGSVLAKNPIPLLIPCHRVLAANKSLCGFSAFGGIELKARMLAIEGVSIVSSPKKAQAKKLMST